MKVLAEEAEDDVEPFVQIQRVLQREAQIVSYLIHRDQIVRFAKFAVHFDHFRWKAAVKAVQNIWNIKYFKPPLS